MQVGGERLLVIPPTLGYGNQKQSGIPAGSTLTFGAYLHTSSLTITDCLCAEVKLVKISSSK